MDYENENFDQFEDEQIIDSQKSLGGKNKGKIEHDQRPKNEELLDHSDEEKSIGNQKEKNKPKNSIKYFIYIIFFFSYAK